MADEFEVIVVGGGTAGLTAALAARHEGASVALVEREERIGGDCTFYGCVPSKALIEIAQTVFDARRLAAGGILESVPAPSFAQVAARRDAVVAEVARDERDERFTAAGIEIVRGRAQFSGEHELDVSGRALRGRRFVIATGSEPAVPPLPGLETVPFLSNRSVFALVELPRRLLVLGGGAIGLELAQAFHRLGSDVSVVELLERLLPGEEPEAGELAAEVLHGEGVRLLLGAEARSVRREGDEVVLETGAGTLRGDVLLVAAGRRGTAEQLRLEEIGVRCEHGYVQIDEGCRTTARHVFAAGDVTGGLQFTHVASHQGSVAGRNAAGGRAKRDERVVPWITFLDPEIARVGLTETQARARHRNVRIATYPMNRVDRARVAGRPAGFVKLVTRRRPLLGWAGGGELVGAQIVGPRAGELIQECALAMRTRAFAGRLTQTIHAYPAMSLAVQQAAAQLFPLGRVLAERGENSGSPAD
ncbi:MAG: NAD(P)/FAD-dependent oxidoreductase [Acidobacteriota bacterium]|nr:NAD(P)/FAD-dependent oxidoreductase [Acidobacteriota bacterium]